MSALLDLEAATAPAQGVVEIHRRQMLAEADQLLDEVEELRLADRHELPGRLAEAVRALNSRLGRPTTAPNTIRAAHNLVLAAQQRLMAANPRLPTPRSHPGRPMGQPVVGEVAGAGRWKFLSLPPRGVMEDREWLDLIDGTVDRACERWAYAHHHAVRSARDHRGSQIAWAAVATARAAWANYWDLREEAARINRRLTPDPPKAPPTAP